MQLHQLRWINLCTEVNVLSVNYVWKDACVTELPARFYFMGPILISCNIYTVIFQFNVIKPRIKVRLPLGLRVRIYSWYVLGDFFLLLLYSPAVLECIGPVNYYHPERRTLILHPVSKLPDESGQHALTLTLSLTLKLPLTLTVTLSLYRQFTEKP